MTFEASLVSFLRTALIIVVVYYGIKFIIRYLSPLLLKWFIRKQQNKYSQYGSSDNSFDKSRKEGEVHIKKTAANRHHTDNQLGDYVDYEEINEKDKDS